VWPVHMYACTPAAQSAFKFAVVYASTHANVCSNALYNCRASWCCAHTRDVLSLVQSKDACTVTNTVMRCLRARCAVSAHVLHAWSVKAHTQARMPQRSLCTQPVTADVRTSLVGLKAGPQAWCVGDTLVQVCVCAHVWCV
jgi:hypothetical protein